MTCGWHEVRRCSQQLTLGTNGWAARPPFMLCETGISLSCHANGGMHARPFSAARQSSRRIWGSGPTGSETSPRACACVCVLTSVCVGVCVCMCACTGGYMCVCVCACPCLYVSRVPGGPFGPSKGATGLDAKSRSPFGQLDARLGLSPSHPRSDTDGGGWEGDWAGGPL